MLIYSGVLNIGVMFISNQFVHTLYAKHLLVWIPHNKFYKDFYVTKGLSSEDMFRFSNINLEIQGENESIAKKNILDGKEMRGNINHIESGTEYASVEGPLNTHRTASNKTTLISEIPNVINK